MPERAIAVLRELVKNAPGTNAGDTALATLDELDKPPSERSHARTPVPGEHKGGEPDIRGVLRTDALFENILQLLDQLKTAIESKEPAPARRLLTGELAGPWADWNNLISAQRLKLESAMTGVRDAKTPDERRQALLNAFTVSAQVLSTARYDLVDVDLTKEAETQLKAIASALDQLEPEGRRALAIFFDSPDFHLRACAAWELPHLMGKRVVAVLSHIIRNPASGNAALTAYEALYGPIDRKKTERKKTSCKKK